VQRVLEDEGVPEILRCPLERVVLQTKLFDMGEPKALLALSLDPPDLTNLENTVLLLKEVCLPVTAVYQQCVRVYI
jgi:ATP-dependent RNA helicase TDRD9